MKFSLIVLVCLSIACQGFPFREFGLASVDEFEQPLAELRRDKRSLTTICVEIKPSNPHEEPYFMCKGTDNPSYSQDSSSDSYSAKPSYKPSKPSNYGGSDSYHPVVKDVDYHAPSKPDYHSEHTKYNAKPSSGYDSPKEYPTHSKPSYGKHQTYDSHGDHHTDDYSSYEAPSKYHKPSYGSTKPSYGDHHDSHDDYSKPHVSHKVTYDKPSAPTYSSIPQIYSHESPSGYDHKAPSGGYSKPYESHAVSPGSYSKPTNSYKPAEYSKPSSYSHSSVYDSKPSYNEDIHSKPSYGGHDAYSHAAPVDTKATYSKPSSYPSKQTSYDHSDKTTQYGQSKPSYSEKPSAISYHSKPPTQDYGKYGSNPQNSAYGPSQSHNYRMAPQDPMQPTWESQPEQLQSDGFGYRSFDTPMEYQRQESPRMMNQDPQLYTGLEGPLKFDLSATEQEGPMLQSPYQQQPYASPPYNEHQIAGYGASSHAPHYAPAAPLYNAPVHTAPANSYAFPLPPYVPVPVSSPSYTPPAPVAPLYTQSLPAPTCPQNYMYTYQPMIMPLPCYSLSPSYNLPPYGPSLGSPANVNPLQDRSSARSEDNSELNHKPLDDHSDIKESQETDKKSEPEVAVSQPVAAKKPDSAKKPSSEIITDEETHQDNTNNSDDDDKQVLGAPEKQNKEEAAAAAATAPKKPEAPHTKEAYDAMMKMARIAAKLNKDETSNKGASDPSAPKGQINEKPSAGALPQMSRTS